MVSYKRNISLSVDAELVNEFDQLAEHYGIARSPLLAALMRRAVERNADFLGEIAGERNGGEESCS